MQTSLSDPGRSRRLIRVAAASASCITLSAGIAVAQVQPAWSEFQGGPAKAGAVADGPEPGYRVAWRLDVEPGGPGGRFGLSAPVVAEDVAVSVAPDQVIGVDVSSGERSFAVDRDLGPSVPAAVAATDGEPMVVYTEGWGDGPPDESTAESTTDDAAPASPSPTTGNGIDAPVDSHVSAVDLRTQEPLWEPVQLDDVSRTGVTVDGDLAFVGANSGTVAAIDLDTGDVAWRQELDVALVTPLAAAEGLVLAGLQGDRDTQPVIVALDAATGEEAWRYEPTATSAVVSAVSVGDSTVFAIFTGLSETSVVAIDAVDGAQRWSSTVNAAFDIAAPPVVGAGLVSVTDLVGHTRAFDAGSGELVWDFALNAPVFRSVPILVGSHLLVPTLDGELGVIDVEAGELVWRRPADGSSLRALAPAGELIVAVRGGSASGLEALEHDPDAGLVLEPSPTTLFLGRMLGAMAIAALPLLALVMLLGRWLGSRMGPAQLHDGDAYRPDPDEPVRDPWEDEDATP